MLKYLTLLLALLAANALHAITYVYFQNNTSLPFTVRALQSGGATLSSSYWGGLNGSLTPWQKITQVLWTNRSTGITSGQDFYLDVRLLNGSDSVQLRVKLTGTTFSSTLYQSATVPGTSHPWYNDRQFHTASFTMQGRSFTLKYKAYFTGGDDDILYALHEENTFPVNAADTADADVLNVFSYNLYMLTPPVASTEQTERAIEIPNHVHNYDVLILSEAFYNSARDNELIPRLAAEYPYRTPVVDASGYADDGGVFIASRFPIDTFAQIVYSDCNGSDCLAAKGAMYARVRKRGRTYHVFGSHTQAWNDTTNVATRILQFNQLRQFIAALNLPASEPVLVGGDLNVDKIVNNRNEYNGMLDSFNAIEPVYIGLPHTYDPTLNNYGSGTDREYLDYVLPLGDYFAPFSATNEVVVMRSIADGVWDHFDLSDHFAIHARLVYPRAAIDFHEPAICWDATSVLRVQTNVSLSYQWYRNNQPIPNATADTLIIGNQTPGRYVYQCQLSHPNGSFRTDSLEIWVSDTVPSPTIAQNGLILTVPNTGFGVVWFLNGQPIAGATDTSLTMTSGGLYQAAYQGNPNCLSALSAPIQSPITVREVSAFAANAQLYPNPARESVFIEVAHLGEWTADVISLDGRAFAQQTYQTTRAELDLSALPAGVYIVRLRANEQTAMLRLIKE